MDNFLGNFNSIEEVHTTHPLGGVQGDYVTIGTENYYWNPFSLEWTTEKPAAVVPVNGVRETNNLGSFSNIEEVYSKYPNGGNEGDYLFIGSVEYVWNKWERVWQNKGNTTPVGGRTANTFDGDLIVGNDLYVGGIFRFKGFSGGGDTPQQSSPTITLKDLNEFPTTPEQAINLVKKGGNAYYTLVDEGKTVGVVNIYADVQRQVLTEVVETRLTLQNDKFTRGHFYEAPRKYWRNYGLQRDFASGFIKKHEWTKWHGWASWRFEFHEEYIKQMAQVFDGSPDKQAHTLEYVLNAANSYFSQEHRDKCLFVSFIDESTQKRVLYKCSKGVFSTNADDWKRLLTEGDSVDTEQKPTVLPFDEVVSNVNVKQLSNSSPIDEVFIVWDKAKNVFASKKDNTYFSNWLGGDDYGEDIGNGKKPRMGVLFYHRSKGEAYTWNGTKMLPMIGHGTEIVENTTRINEEEIDTITNE